LRPSSTSASSHTTVRAGSPALAHNFISLHRALQRARSKHCHHHKAILPSLTALVTASSQRHKEPYGNSILGSKPASIFLTHKKTTDSFHRVAASGDFRCCYIVTTAMTRNHTKQTFGTLGWYLPEDDINPPTGRVVELAVPAQKTISGKRVPSPKLSIVRCSKSTCAEYSSRFRHRDENNGRRPIANNQEVAYQAQRV
jgi:hypothetical protein